MGRVIIQPGILVSLVHKTLGNIPGLAVVIIATLMSIAAAGDSLERGGDFRYVRVSITSIVTFAYVVLLILMLLWACGVILYLLTVIFGPVLAFLAWIWAGLGVMGFLLLFPREVYEKWRELLGRLRDTAGKEQVRQDKQ
jgi:hypothetical protein